MKRANYYVQLARPETSKGGSPVVGSGAGPPKLLGQ